jgi:metal-responsive CopG/Arc/MetJ family transcriptional regulator
LQMKRKNRRLHGIVQKESHLRLPLDLSATIDGQSKELGISRSHFIQDALECYCAEIERISKIPAKGLGLDIQDE